MVEKHMNGQAHPIGGEQFPTVGATDNITLNKGFGAYNCYPVGAGGSVAIILFYHFKTRLMPWGLPPPCGIAVHLHRGFFCRDSFPKQFFHFFTLRFAAGNLTREFFAAALLLCLGARLNMESSSKIGMNSR
jgi:hypothetical protein